MAAPDLQNEMGHTPLRVAQEEGHLEVVRVLERPGVWWLGNWRPRHPPCLVCVAYTTPLQLASK